MSPMSMPVEEDPVEEVPVEEVPVEEESPPGITGDLGTVAEVLDRASVPVGLLGTDGVVLYTNESFARACGRPAGELVGAVLANSVVADDRVGLHSVLTVLGDDPDPQAPSEPAVDVRFVGADGRVRATRLNLAVLTGDLAQALTEPRDPNRSELVICIATDRSEERRSERGNRRARVEEAVSAMTDPATGLLNARGMELTLESASRRAGRNDAVFALVHCVVEAATDHPGGASEDVRGEAPIDDETLLMACVERIRQRLRPSDTVARSEDAIVVVAEDLGDEQDAAGVTYRVLSTVVEPVPTDNSIVTVQMHAGTVVANGATPVHQLGPAAAEAAHEANYDGGFQLVDMRR